MLMPEIGSIYDFVYDRESQRWMTWQETVDKESFTIPPKAKVS